MGGTASARAKARHEALNPTAKRRWDVFQWSVGVEESVVSEGASVLQSEGAEQRWETRHCYLLQVPFSQSCILIPWYVSIHALIDELGDHGWCTLYLTPRRFQKKVVTVPRVVTKADLIVEPSVYSHGTPGLTGLLDGEHLRKSGRCQSACAARQVGE